MCMYVCMCVSFARSFYPLNRKRVTEKRRRRNVNEATVKANSAPLSLRSPVFRSLQPPSHSRMCSFELLFCFSCCCCCCYSPLLFPCDLFLKNRPPLTQPAVYTLSLFLSPLALSFDRETRVLSSHAVPSGGSASCLCRVCLSLPLSLSLFKRTRVYLLLGKLTLSTCRAYTDSPVSLLYANGFVGFQ